MSWLRRLLRWALLDEGSTRGLGLVRIGVALMLWTRFADWFLVHPDSTARDLVLAAAFHGGSLLLLLGAWTRLANLLVAAVLLYGYAWLLPVERDLRWSSNNINLLVFTTSILALTDSGRSYSVDRWRALGRAARRGLPPPLERAPLWGYRLLGLLVSSVYLSTWWDKTSWAYLDGQRLQSIFATHYTGSAYLDAPAWEGLVLVSASGVWALEGLLVFGLAIPRLRAAVALTGVVLHGSFTALFRVFAFSQNMILLYLPWFPPGQVHALLDRVAGPGQDPEARPVPTGRARLAVRLLAVLVVLGGLGWAGARDLRDPQAAAQVQLLTDRMHTAWRPAKEDQRHRNRQDRRDMQRWVRP